MAGRADEVSRDQTRGEEMMGHAIPGQLDRKVPGWQRAGPRI